MTASSYYRIDGLMQERRNSSALAMELRLSCTNPLILHTSQMPYDVRSGRKTRLYPSLTRWGRVIYTLVN